MGMETAFPTVLIALIYDIGKFQPQEIVIKPFKIEIRASKLCQWQFCKS